MNFKNHSHRYKAFSLVVLGVAFAWRQAPAQSQFVDDAHRVVVMPKTVARTFAAGAPAEVLLYTLAPETMVGRNHLPGKQALEFMPPELRNPLPISKLPRAQDASNDAELVLLKPDIYVDYGDLHADYINSVNQVQARTGIPSIILDGSLEKIPATYRKLGLAMHLEKRSELLAKEIERLLKKYHNSLSKSGSALRVYLACSGDAAIPCLEGERNGEIAHFLGVTNVAGSVDSLPVRPVTIDDIKHWNPEAIVMPSAQAAAKMLGDTEWQTVPAVKNHKVYAAPNEPFSWGPRPPSVNRVPGLIWLRYVLVGRAFDADFFSDIRLFYKMFYHVTLSDEQLQRLVK